MIGHLQRNKVKYIAEYITMIHSVDTFELAQTIEKEAAKHDRVIPVLIEVNVAGEDTKYGVRPEDAEALIERISHLPHVRVSGLMTSAPYVENPEEDRIYFRNLRNLSVDIEDKKLDNVTVGALSMGMSNDYEIAVEEGSTMVRVGTSIFGERDYSKK
jgi:pyridoxal phosphate enzyme (YggS family)